jgi:glutamine amidotransferase
MGWNQVRQIQSHPMWQGLDDYSRFYFVHSYHAAEVSEDQQAGSCDYGFNFTAAVCRGNVFAVQFHPEKSASHGLQLLENFLRWAP